MQVINTAFQLLLPCDPPDTPPRPLQSVVLLCRALWEYMHDPSLGLCRMLSKPIKMMMALRNVLLCVDLPLYARCVCCMHIRVTHGPTVCGCTRLWWSISAVLARMLFGKSVCGLACSLLCLQDVLITGSSSSNQCCQGRLHPLHWTSLTSCLACGSLQISVVTPSTHLHPHMLFGLSRS